MLLPYPVSVGLGVEGQGSTSRAQSKVIQSNSQSNLATLVFISTRTGGSQTGWETAKGAMPFYMFVFICSKIPELVDTVLLLVKKREVR